MTARGSAAVLLGVLVGCAPGPSVAPPRATAVPPEPVAAPPVPAVGDTAGAGGRIGPTASGGAIVARRDAAAALADSAPSPEAIEVLRTIPEPLGGREAPDSEPAPVPAPTLPLGDRPGARPLPVLPESLAAPVAAPPAAPAQTAAAAPDTCWRVQVAAPPERERAERIAAVARSQLLLAFRVEPEGGLFKVRTVECLSSAAASDLRRRANDSGFDGAFRFRERSR